MCGCPTTAVQPEPNFNPDLSRLVLKNGIALGTVYTNFGFNYAF